MNNPFGLTTPSGDTTVLLPPTAFSQLNGNNTGKKQSKPKKVSSKSKQSHKTSSGKNKRSKKVSKSYVSEDESDEEEESYSGSSYESEDYYSDITSVSDGSSNEEDDEPEPKKSSNKKKKSTKRSKTSSTTKQPIQNVEKQPSPQKNGSSQKTLPPKQPSPQKRHSQEISSSSPKIPVVKASVDPTKPNEEGFVDNSILTIINPDKLRRDAGSFHPSEYMTNDTSTMEPVQSTQPPAKRSFTNISPLRTGSMDIRSKPSEQNNSVSGRNSGFTLFQTAKDSGKIPPTINVGSLPKIPLDQPTDTIPQKKSKSTSSSSKKRKGSHKKSVKEESESESENEETTDEEDDYDEDTSEEEEGSEEEEESKTSSRKSSKNSTKSKSSERKQSHKKRSHHDTDIPDTRGTREEVRKRATERVEKQMGSEFHDKIKERELLEKRQIMWHLYMMQKQGYPVSKNYTETDSLYEMRFELEKSKQEGMITEKFENWWNNFTTIHTLGEMINEQLNPIGISVDGLTNNLDQSKPSYERILRRYYRKRLQFNTQTNPIVELAFLYLTTTSLFIVPRIIRLFNKNKEETMGNINQPGDQYRPWMPSSSAQIQSNNNQNDDLKKQVDSLRSDVNKLTQLVGSTQKMFETYVLKENNRVTEIDDDEDNNETPSYLQIAQQSSESEKKLSSNNSTTNQQHKHHQTSQSSSQSNTIYTASSFGKSADPAPPSFKNVVPKQTTNDEEGEPPKGYSSWNEYRRVIRSKADNMINTIPKVENEGKIYTDDEIKNTRMSLPNDMISDSTKGTFTKLMDTLSNWKERKKKEDVPELFAHQQAPSFDIPQDTIDGFARIPENEFNALNLPDEIVNRVEARRNQFNKPQSSNDTKSPNQQKARSTTKKTLNLDN